MLNPDGGKMGKSPRRRAVSMDNSTKYLKSKGRVRGKRVGRPGIGAGSVVAGLQGSPDQSSPPQKGLPGAGGASGIDGEFDAWTDLHSRASSSASTLSGRLSPILAEGEPEEPEEGGLSCSTSPHLYPSPNSTRSPTRGAGNLCPPLEQLPQLANLTGAISLDEQLVEDSYHHHHATQHKHPAAVYHYSSGVKGQSPYGAGVYGATSMGMLRHHSPMQTIQENKPASFSGTMRAYSSTNALQSLLTGGPVRQQYCSKDMMLGQERESHPMMGQASNGVGSGPHSHHAGHLNGHSHNGTHGHSSAHSHNRTHSHTSSHNHNNVTNHNHNSPLSIAHNGHNLSQSHNHTPPRGVALIPRGNGNQLHSYNHKAPYLYSPPSHAHLPASTTLPPNPAGMLGMPQDSCHVATAPHPRHNHYPDPQHQGMANGPYHHGQGIGNGSIGSNYHGYHHPHPHERLPADLDIDMFHGSLDCDVESILLHDIMDSGEEMDFNFDCSLAQGVGIGMGMGMGVTMGMGMGMSGLTGPQQGHSNQSWVPG
ncbi:forkhead box protein O3-like isoform 3-T3 [Spinachia spinachia]